MIVTVLDSMFTDEQLSGIVELGRKFHVEAEHPSTFVDGNFRSFVATNVNLALMAVDKEYKGMLLFIVTTLPWDHTTLLAQEFLWYVPQENRHSGVGKKLLEVAVVKARELGISQLRMADNILSNNMEGFYNSIGANFSERIFELEVN